MESAHLRQVRLGVLEANVLLSICCNLVKLYTCITLIRAKLGLIEGNSKGNKYRWIFLCWDGRGRSFSVWHWKKTSWRENRFGQFDFILIKSSCCIKHTQVQKGKVNTKPGEKKKKILIYQPKGWWQNVNYFNALINVNVSFYLWSNLANELKPWTHIHPLTQQY